MKEVMIVIRFASNNLVLEHWKLLLQYMELTFASSCSLAHRNDMFILLQNTKLVTHLFTRIPR